MSYYYYYYYYYNLTSSPVRRLLVTVSNKGTTLVHVGNLVPDNGEVSNGPKVRENVVQPLLVHRFGNLPHEELHLGGDVDRLLPKLCILLGKSQRVKGVFVKIDQLAS